MQASQNQEFIQHFPPAVRCLAASLKQSFIAILSTYPFFPAFIAKHNTTTTCGIEYALGQLEVTCLDVSPPSLWALFSFLNIWAQQGEKNRTCHSAYTVHYLMKHRHVINTVLVTNPKHSSI